jgi:hypothetical protein
MRMKVKCTAPRVPQAQQQDDRSSRRHPPDGTPVRAARMLALAYHIESLITAGQFVTYSDAARCLKITRARMTQVMNLINLPAPVQEALLMGTLQATERQLRTALRSPVWSEQPAVLIGEASLETASHHE